MANAKLDCKKVRCPMPIVQTAKKIKELEVGDLLEIEADDPVFVPDIQSWCRKTKHELVSLTKNDNVAVAVIKKAAA